MAENILWKRQWIEIKMGHRRDFYPIVHGTIYILGDCARPKLDEEQPKMMRFWRNTCFQLPFKTRLSILDSKDKIIFHFEERPKHEKKDFLLLKIPKKISKDCDHTLC